MTKQRRAEGLLVLTTAFWGVSYYFTRICLRQMDPLTLNAFRFLTAFLVLGLIYRKNLRALNRETAKWGALVGLVLVVVYVAATYGVMNTSLSNAGFISGLAVLITPLIELAVFRKKPGKRLALALALCTAGLALLTLGGGVRFAVGDLLCLMCSAFYAADIVITDRAVSRPAVDPIGMSVVEIGVTGAVFLALALVLEQPRLPQTPAVWGAALTLGLFCSGIAFVIQTTQQRYTSPARVALIFTLEPVFSAAVAYVLAGERLHSRGYLGAALMILSLLLTQLPNREPRRKDDTR
ncbi:MAG: DMT family transporter [Clostridia bacterium]|nr:DMT family transporter [Clostridia bacterium]